MRNVDLPRNVTADTVNSGTGSACELNLCQRQAFCVEEPPVWKNQFPNFRGRSFKAGLTSYSDLPEGQYALVSAPFIGSD